MDPLWSKTGSLGLPICLPGAPFCSLCPPWALQGPILAHFGSFGLTLGSLLAHFWLIWGGACRHCTTRVGSRVAACTCLVSVDFPACSFLQDRKIQIGRLHKNVVEINMFVHEAILSAFFVRHHSSSWNTADTTSCFMFGVRVSRPPPLYLSILATVCDR